MKFKILVIFLLILIVSVGYFNSKKIDQIDFKFSKTAVIVLDMQKDFLHVDGRFPIAKNQICAVVENCNEIINRCKNSGTNLIYVHNEFNKAQLFTNWIRNNSAMEGSQGAQFDERLQIINHVFFSKKVNSAFSNKDLGRYLNEKKIGRLVIVGVYAEACVTDTVKDALKRGYEVIVVEDAIGSSNEVTKIRTLEKFKKEGIKIISIKDFLKNM